MKDRILILLDFHYTLLRKKDHINFNRKQTLNYAHVHMKVDHVNHLNSLNRTKMTLHH
jgi:hypothetical protein